MEKNHIKEYLAIGQVRKSHGLEGVIKIVIYPRMLEAALEADHYFIHTQGQKLPLFIEWIEGEGENYQVKFEDIDDPQSASQLSSKELFMSKQEIAEVTIPASTQLPIDHTDLNGYEIHDLTTGIRVVIEEVIEMPSQLMAQVSLNQKPYLIPLVPTLIERIDDITKEIEIHLPHGIFEL
ncbi:MAG: hypothetical protein LCH44_04375 [Bacteroidetes bacterium]|nr:hypothetical protein [Bacteroidota bacterium]HQU96266.1 hypothetical protein [Saprospiraceae bacterium]